jgi:predicted cobalt transporter CbtA
LAGEGACAFEETAIPADWTSSEFDDSTWPAATEHSENAVRPKDGYDRIDWDSSARLIWSDDLLQDNTLLCRLTVSQ